MEPVVFLAVLSAAAMHAGWNAVVKTGLDRMLSITLINGCAGLVALAGIVFVPFPIPEAWPWILASAAVHTLYKLALIRAYDSGDMGQVYPLARGAGPMIVTVVSLLFLDETLSRPALAGILVLGSGIMMMSLKGGRPLSRLDPRAVFFALATSVCIASYTLVDGVGARIAGDASAYTLYLFTIDAAIMATVCLAVRGPSVIPRLATAWRSGLAGGLMSLGAYWIVIWAMTVAPIPAVAALRETSVLFALVIATVVLREPLIWQRLSAAIVILAGIVLIRL